MRPSKINARHDVRQAVGACLYVEIYWFLSISTTDVTTFVATDAFCGWGHKQECFHGNKRIQQQWKRCFLRGP
jgi:hypothetical protein